LDISELEVGMEVRIICWDHKPEHWSMDMAEWQGEVVTISDCEGDDNDTYVYIEEDEGEWTWQTWDFEPYSRLSRNNPNILYLNRKNHKFFNEMREKYKRFEK